MYEERAYRAWVKADDLRKIHIGEKETDLFILVDKDLTNEARKSIHKYRSQVEDFIKLHPDFKEALEPWPFHLSGGMGEPAIPPDRWNGLPIIKEMIEAARIAGVGPMAAIAGAMAEFVGKDLLRHSKEVIVENGGDIFLATRKTRTFGIFAGSSPLTGKLSFEIISPQAPLGVCTSSGTVGHSLSFGKADAAIIISGNTARADAIATACANIVKDERDVEKAANFASSQKDVLAAIVIKNELFASWGKAGFKWSLKN